MVGAAVLYGCKRALISDLTAGRLERRRAISASSSMILTSAELWVHEYVDTSAGGAALGAETELNMGPYEIEAAASCPGWRRCHSSMRSCKNRPGDVTRYESSCG